MVFIKNKENKKVGINWVEFLAFIVVIYLILTKLIDFVLFIAFSLAQMKGGV